MSSPSFTSMHLRPLFLLGLMFACAMTLSACRESPVDAPAPKASPQVESPQAPVQPDVSTEIAEAPPAEGVVEGKAFPAEVCAPDQGWAFLNAYVLADEATRRRYSEGDAAAGFRIAMVDSRWSIREPAGTGGEYSRVELKEIPSGDDFVVEYVRARYAPNDDVVSTHGEPGRYVFAIRDGCWKLLDRAP